jgi:hypothetical protein
MNHASHQTLHRNQAAFVPNRTKKVARLIGERLLCWFRSDLPHSDGVLPVNEQCQHVQRNKTGECTAREKRDAPESILEPP